MSLSLSFPQTQVGFSLSLPLMSHANEAWDTLERSFDVRGSIEDEDEGAFIATNLQQEKKFVDSGCV